ncbi:MAG: winged helix-turn-helix transcriptional regulator, partial [Saprospiraceae bacterium]|nr:winged helix-turn-helix transcriptional regulator [Saprospiraceae bacterium]
SRVLPIVKKDHRYEIRFASEFSFQPETLVPTIDQVFEEAGLSSNYIVEVEECETRQTVYSFEMNEAKESDIVPCQARVQPFACYVLVVSLFDPYIYSLAAEQPIGGSINGASNYLGFGLLAILALGAITFFWRKKSEGAIGNPNLVQIGKFQFDKLNTKLENGKDSVELSGKEAELLLLLHKDVNQTLKKEFILQKVWGDKGDYVGRTLDVFISKLRKKLESDQNLKIVNIRGVGYKLVVNVGDRLS